MATLTETAFVTRKAINIGAVVLVVLVILRVSFGVIAGLWQKVFPPPPPPATVAFGKLGYPAAQNMVATPAGKATFTLETADGALPTIPVTMKVFFMPRAGPAFGSFDRMKMVAAKLGFLDIPRKVSATAWRFSDPATPLRSVDIDEISGHYHLTYNFLSDLAVFNDKSFSLVEEVVSQARSFFGGVVNADLGSAVPVVRFFRLDAGAMVETTSLSAADALGVTFNRGDIDKLPVVAPDWKWGLVSILYSGSSEPKKKVLEGRYFYTPVDLENWATYPVVTAAQAWEKLKAGRAIYASLPTTQVTNVVIRRIYPALLDPYPAQSFLQPVLVFSDERGFVAYVPLVSPEWLD